MRSLVCFLLALTLGQAAEPLRILVVGNYHSSQNKFPQQLDLLAEHCGLPAHVHMVNGIYGHGHLNEDIAADQGLQWIRGEGKATRKGRPLKGTALASVQPFLGAPPDVVVLQVECYARAEQYKGGGLERIIEATGTYAALCTERKVRLLLWIHPGLQHNHFKGKKSDRTPLSEEHYAADLATIDANIAKLRAVAPEAAVIPYHRAFARFRDANPDMDLQAPEGDPDTHLSGRDHYFLACCTVAALGAARPATAPDLEAANALCGYAEKALEFKHKKDIGPADVALTTAQQAAIHAAAWP